MKATYKYCTIETEPESAAVDLRLQQAQETGWEYVSGPAVTRGVYLFLLRKPIPADGLTQAELELRIGASGPASIESAEVHPANKPF